MSISEAVSESLPQRLVYEFEELDLSPYEARVLLALVRLGAANTAQLARESGVPRTSTYQILSELQRKGLAQPVSVDGPAMWASPGREEVFNRLDAIQEEKLRQHQARTSRLRRLVAEAFPDENTAAGPYVHVIQGVGQVTLSMDKLLAGVETELLMCNRPPHSTPSDRIKQALLAAIGRGVCVRCLYQRADWKDPRAERFRARMGAYHRAGAQARLVDELPLKVTIADRKMAVLVMSDPVQAEVGFPVTLRVEHPGYATLQAYAFDRLWEQGTPLSS